MNRTEIKAYNWLLERDVAVIKQLRSHPKFRTGDGKSYQPKRLNGQSITFSDYEAEALKRVDNLYVLLFRDELDEPIAIIPYQEIDFDARHWKHISIYIVNFREMLMKRIARAVADFEGKRVRK